MTGAEPLRFAELADGGKLAYRRSGSFESHVPLVLLRPLGGSMTLWGEFARALAQRLPVIAFDPRGVGASSDAPWRCSTRAMARDAVALLNALGVGRANVFGLSLGGMVASWMAADAPERVARLVLASTLPSLGEVSHRVAREALGLARAFCKRGADAEVALVNRVLSDEFRRKHPARVAEIDRLVRETPSSRRNLLLLALAAARHDARSALAGVEVRTLLLVGRLDPIVGGTAERELLHDLPNGRLQFVEDAGHDLSLEAPTELASRVIAFLEDTTPVVPVASDPPSSRVHR